MEQQMSLKQSTNYIWDIADLLGGGACGNVYRGMRKANADPVAVKVYYGSTTQRITETQLKEISLIKRLKHSNIVKLLDIEQEEKTKKPVIVMELCTGGSLFKILEDPENCFGLPEDEFLLVLEHVAAGTQYLRHENVVHRDLKPANIMKFVGDDGRSVYKLIDFDSARELADNQEFFSLYGTEEYLHPDMYEQYLLPQPNAPQKRFSASNDLWSVGATLYHVATGQLPFRPFMRRKDPQTMHQMTARKAPGVISAYQTKHNGKIIYEKTLPETCCLSSELKTLLIPLLASLMEVDPRKKYNYDKFFLAVKDILSRKRVHIFEVNHVTSFRLYLNMETQNNYDDILKAIQVHTNILPENQILLHKGRSVFQLLDCGKRSTDALPVTTIESPLILCNRIDADVVLPQVKSPNFLAFYNIPDAVKDYEVSKYNCSAGHEIKRKIENACLSAQLLSTAAQTISQLVILNLTTVAKEQTHIQSVVNSLSNQFEMMKAFLSFSNVFLNHVKSNGNMDLSASLANACKNMEETLSEHIQQFDRLNSRLAELSPAIVHLLDARVEKRSLLSEWESSCAKVPAINSFNLTPTSAASVVDKLCHSFQFFASTESVVTSNQSSRTYYYLLQRMKMEEQTKVMKKIYELDCKTTLVKLVDAFSDWFKDAQAAFFKPEILAKDIVEARNDVTKCESSLDGVVKEFLQQLQNFGEALGERANQPIASFVSPDRSTKAAKRLHKSMKAFALVHKEIRNNSKESLDLCNQLKSLMEASLLNVNQL